MTKSEKKKIIFDLLTAAESEQDLESKEKLLVEAITEIYSSGFTLENLKKVSNVVNLFIKDIPLEYSKDFKFFSKAALTVVIDWSLLND